MALEGSSRMLQEFNKRVISPTSKWDHPLIPTLDPNFQQDMQVVSFLGFAGRVGWVLGGSSHLVSG